MFESSIRPRNEFFLFFRNCLLYFYTTFVLPELNSQKCFSWTERVCREYGVWSQDGDGCCLDHNTGSDPPPHARGADQSPGTARSCPHITQGTVFTLHCLPYFLVCISHSLPCLLWSLSLTLVSLVSAQLTIQRNGLLLLLSVSVLHCCSAQAGLGLAWPSTAGLRSSAAQQLRWWYQGWIESRLSQTFKYSQVQSRSCTLIAARCSERVANYTLSHNCCNIVQPLTTLFIYVYLSRLIKRIECP